MQSSRSKLSDALYWITGFGLCGTPDTLIEALSRRKDVGNLTAVSNNVGSGDKGLGGSRILSGRTIVELTMDELRD